MQDVEVQLVAPDRLRQDRLIDARAREREAQQMARARLQALGDARLHRGRQFLRDHVADQRARDFVMRAHEHVDHVAFLDDAPRIQHRDAIAHVLDHFHLVRDEDDRETELAVDAAQQIENRAGRLGVERGRRFVGQQHFRLARERARDADALLLPAADLRRIAVLLRGEADQIE
ncbi:hypothetical protein PTBPS01_30045 [Burkholderia pseudomallei]|nr:hypothetical protein PTBPS01_30045 [Burkholderia pseudomallei]